jgi:hypothetical protein
MEELTPAKPSVEEQTDSDAWPAVEILEEKQVVLRCTFTNNFFLARHVRIWPHHVFLIDNNSGLRSRLLSYQHIPAYPQFTEVDIRKTLEFTLVFGGLPRDCTSFDFIEIIPVAGGFKVKGIARNEMDVYYVKV